MTLLVPMEAVRVDCIHPVKTLLLTMTACPYKKFYSVKAVTANAWDPRTRRCRSFVQVPVMIYTHVFKVKGEFMIVWICWEKCAQSFETCVVTKQWVKMKSYGERTVKNPGRMLVRLSAERWARCRACGAWGLVTSIPYKQYINSYAFPQRAHTACRSSCHGDFQPSHRPLAGFPACIQFQLNVFMTGFSN